jgi:hypothetical protein
VDHLVRFFIMTAVAASLCACGSTQNLSKNVQFVPPPGNFKVAVMKPDVQVSLLTAGGLEEPNADWTEKARGLLMESLVRQLTAKGGSIFLMEGSVANDALQVADLERLNRVVGATIFQHRFSTLTDLPTKKGKFDWTLGADATALKAATGADYGLFLFARDSFSSGGRQALQVLGFASCIVGICLAPGGGSQVGFVSLVDLGNGNIVWFNVLAKGSGDLRDPAGADASIHALIDKMLTETPAARK